MDCPAGADWGNAQSLLCQLPVCYLWWIALCCQHKEINICSPRSEVWQAWTTQRSHRGRRGRTTQCLSLWSLIKKCPSCKRASRMSVHFCSMPRTLVITKASLRLGTGRALPLGKKQSCRMVSMRDSHWARRAVESSVKREVKCPPG